jgi:endonuclease/exonuclease/phosphatase family metal-dependent hydrolase
MNKKKTTLFLVLFSLVFYTISSQEKPETIRIMSFNIQIFGAAKMAKPEVVGILVDLASQADLIAVQEVRSLNIEPVERFMSMLPKNYSYALGPRQGRSNSKEQYWLIYDTEKITLLKEDSWPDEEDIFERSPQALYLKTQGSFDFILLNNHIQPGAADKEIRALPKVAAYYMDLWDDPDLMIVGDFNADGRYFNSPLLDLIFPEDEYFIIITDEYDTTVAQSHNSYDRFIITLSALDNFSGSFGVIRFDELYDFGAIGIQPREVSDHYPIWAEFYTGRAYE